MIRLIALIAIPVTIFFVLTAEAQDAPAADGRYMLRAVEDGFIRLDTKTGRVSFCNKPGREWVCEAVEDDMAAINREFDALLTENAELKNRVERLQRGARPVPERDMGENGMPQLRLPTDEELDQVMTMFNDAMRRFMDMIRSWQEDQQGERDKL